MFYVDINRILYYITSKKIIFLCYESIKQMEISSGFPFFAMSIQARHFLSSPKIGNLSSLPNDVLRALIRSHLSDVEALIFRSTCQHARELVLTTKGKENILDTCIGKLYIYAASIGSSSFIDWLCKHQKIPLQQFQFKLLCINALAGNNPKVVLKRLVSMGAKVDVVVAAAAARRGDKELLIWVCSVAGINEYAGYRLYFFSEAARGGHVSMMAWLYYDKRCAYPGYMLSSGDGKRGAGREHRSDRMASRTNSSLPMGFSYH